MPWAQARQEICAGAGSQFDPTVVEAYRQLSDATFLRLSVGVRTFTQR